MINSTPIEKLQGGLLPTTFTASETHTERVKRYAYKILFISVGIQAIAGRWVDLSRVRLLTLAARILVGRKMVAALVGRLVYPATFSHNYDHQRVQVGKSAKQYGWILKRITLHKSGTTYDAFLIGTKKTINNGNWTLRAQGNGIVVESVMARNAEEDQKAGSNTLIINGPRVGRSNGWPTRFQMRAGFQSGLEYLESVIKAKKIAMEGWSLGGGMLAEVVVHHTFKKEIAYHFTSERSFSRLSTEAAAVVGSIVYPIFWFLGIELNGVAAANKLTRENIRHVIVENPKGDGVIAESATLRKTLKTAKNRHWITNEKINHKSDLPEQVRKDLTEEKRRFFSPADDA